MSKELLVILVQNPVWGEVKPKIAKTMGNDKALFIYNSLIKHTFEITHALKCDKSVYYSQFIQIDDIWNGAFYRKALQKGKEWNEVMDNIMKDFEAGHYEKLVITCCDFMTLASAHIEEAFDKLTDFDAVLGPTQRGGYYLMGIRKRHPNLFVGKKPNDENLLLDTVLELQKNNCKVAFLDPLRAIRTDEDYHAFKGYFSKSH